MKKVIVIILILFLIVMGVAIAVLLKKRAVTQAPATTSNGGLTAPFGSASDDRSPTTNTNLTVGQNNGVSVKLAELTHVFTEPTSGMIITPSKNGLDASLRFTERATGHIYDVALDTGAVTRTSNTTIPKIYESIWMATGSTTIFRYLNDTADTIQTYSAKLIANASSDATSTQATASIQGTFLPENIVSLSGSPVGTRIFYLTEISTGSQGVIAGSDGSKKTAIYSSAISEWITQWPEESTITLTSKSSSSTKGYLYFMTTAGSMRRILGDVTGLATLTSPKATLVAYTNSNSNLQILDIKSGKTISVASRTIADKCVWSVKQKDTLYCAVPTIIPVGSYPEAWYQGSVSFSDELYRIDATTGTTTLIGGLKSKYGLDIDAVNLTLGKSEDFLTFIDKRDLSLWTLRLTNEGSQPGY